MNGFPDPTGLQVIEHIAPELSRIYIERLRHTQEVLIPVLSRIMPMGMEGFLTQMQTYDPGVSDV